MLSEPKLENRGEKPYLGIRTQVPWQELPVVIPQFIGEVFGLLSQNGVSPAAAPFIRYHVVDMAGKMDITVGWPVATAVTGSGRVAPGVIPSGRYATVVYTGNYPGLIEANAALFKWGAEQGLTWDSQVTDNGDAFGGRFESYWTNPADEPDMNKHETEVAIRLADR